MTGTRKNIMLGTAGHVDHGKTALVKLLTGCETDTLSEEKQRGLTIDLGFAPCKLADDRIVGVVDVPGHVDFIRNMVAGAHGIDLVILVVAADDGIMPQTHEHLHILTLMGLRHGLVALTKIDIVSHERREEVIAELGRWLAGTFLANAPICPISSVTGQGFETFFEALNRVVDSCGDRSALGLFRLWVEDVFPIRGSGTIVTGIPSSGVVRVNDRLSLLPIGAGGRVRRMQVYGEEAAEGRAGECVALNLPELEHDSVRRGMLLSSPHVTSSSTMAEGELLILSSLKKPVRDNSEVQFHIGTASVMARMALLEANSIAPGQIQMVQFHFVEPLPLAPGERFVLRANVGAAGQSGLTSIGGGRILGISETRLRRRKPWIIERLSARRDALAEPSLWCEQMLREAHRPLSPAQLRELCLRPAEEISALLDSLLADRKIVAASGGKFVHRQAIERTAGKVLAELESCHASNPDRAGLTGDELFSRCGHEETAVFDLAVTGLVQNKSITFNGTVYALAGWKARVPDRDQQLSDRLAAAFHESRWSSPALSELAASFNLPPNALDKPVRLLIERGVLVRLDDRVLMHRDAIEEAKEVVLRLFKSAPSFSTMQFRDALGVSRKYAVPLLDHLDKVRFTVRSGHDRTPGVEARKFR
jgi:selenocysteine-specific elongation factor